MKVHEDYPEVSRARQTQILKLVTNSFYRELVNYGVDDSDIVTVSVHLLDHITNKKNPDSNGSEYYNTQFTIKEIEDRWQEERRLSIQQVTIRPLKPEMIPTICPWLKAPEVERTLIHFFPKDQVGLRAYLFDRINKLFFGIFHREEELVGIIGADHIDHRSKKVEMKKLIGNPDYRGKGIGKLATFLFLYYVFMILKFKKVYIYSMDTNIHNINLNSRFGFELEGILFSEVLVDGVYRDVLRMGLICDDWQEIFGDSR